MTQVLAKASPQVVLEWLEGNVGRQVPQPSEEKFIPFAIGDDWTMFVYQQSSKVMVEVWLPSEAAPLFALRFAHADQ